METNSRPPIGLDQLPELQWATVSGMALPSDPIDRTLVLRLLELGFVPGERVQVIREGRHRRDPIAVRLGHTTFGLRHREAAFIQVIPAA